ncbi:MAG: bifunctional 2-polyprenyl-6-hydroxyphenol methylase/3-demethylubiquinol 3-O-methyltransferase UbiG [Alphaproteobacteria bacterium]|nr:bifunctional 2-polyprenyl-6-hydroxyphenol methylase/3-demethylubiquinol 3-O-methyltransferase UbiG [Alphaproteobacteria bacterium]
MTTADIKRENTVDSAEIARFSALADAWWDPEGDFRPLHRFNPIRLRYIRDQICDHFDCDKRSLTPLEGLSVLDVGCGGGLVTEPIARMGAIASAIDASEKNIGVASLHAEQGGLDIDYRVSAAETLAEEQNQFDVVMALEIVEHVADMDLFISSCAALTKPDGMLILATLNRTAKAFALAIVGAEYLLRWMPRGTHRWDRFVKPSELARALSNSGVEVADMTGVTYNPLKDDWRLSKDVAVNYMLCATKL